MNRKFFILLVSAFLVSSFCGCTVVYEYAPAREEVKIAPAEQELARKLLQAFIENDAAGFVKLLPESMSSKFTEEAFAETRKAVIESVGEPMGYSYLTTLELAPLHPQIWKVRFRRSNVNNSKEFTSEVLFKVVTGMANGQEAVVTAFHFL